MSRLFTLVFATKLLLYDWPKLKLMLTSQESGLLCLVGYPLTALPQLFLMAFL